MLNLEQVKSYYPENLRKYEQFIFKEYLQYLILEIIFKTKFANKLSFLWWTNLRIVHNNSRFSEDLDFDNLWLNVEEFEKLSLEVKKELEKLSFEVEIKTVFKWAFRCYIRIPKLLKELWFSNLEDEKILIQIDTAPHDFDYTLETKLLNKFWLFFRINTTPLDILLSQKIWSIFNRPRKKWRDFFDTVFLFALTKPNLEYLKSKLWFNDFLETKLGILKLCETLDFQELASDVEPFLFEESWKNRVLYFKEFIEWLEL